MSHLSHWLRRVYILGEGLLFDEIIAHMLASDSNLRLIRRVYMEDAGFLTDVSWLHPEVILLNGIERFTCTRMLALLFQISLATDLRVITISLKNNDINIFASGPDE